MSNSQYDSNGNLLTNINQTPSQITNNVGAIINPATEDTLSSLNNKTATLVSGRVPVDGSAITQPVNVTNASIAITGALTDAQLRANVVPVSLTSTTISNFPVTQAISASSLPLPTGAATETSLSSVNTKIPTGLTVKAASTSAVATDQALVVAISPNNSLTTTISGTANVNVTNASIPVTGTFFQSTQPVSIASSVAVTGPLTDIQLRASAVPVSISGVATAANQTTGNTSLNNIDLKTPSLGQALMANSSPVVIASNQTSIPVTGTFFQATQPVSGTVTVGNASLVVTGPLTDTQLRATAVPVSLTSTTVSNFPATQAISAVTLPLPTGAATSALQTTANNSLSSIDSKALPAGQAVMASSSPVVIASNQSNIPVTATSLPLPTGAATETTLSSVLTAVQVIDNTQGSVSGGTAGINSNLVGGIFNTTLPTLTNGQQVANQVDNKGRFLNPVTNGRLSYMLSTTTTTSAAGFGAPANANKDIFRFNGSASKVIYIKKIRISATANATQGNNVAIVKRSASNSGGTVVSSTLVPSDSTQVASTASAFHYTTTSTSDGTSVGVIRATKLLIPTTTTVYNPEIVFEFNENNGNPLVLRGIAEGFGIILNAAPAAGNNFLINVEWDEET